MHDVKPEKGMGATKLLHSDRHACTIVAVYEKYCVVQCDNATRIDTNGMSDCQTYEFTPNNSGQLHILRLRKNGKWREVETDQLFAIGYRDEHYDYSY